MGGISRLFKQCGVYLDYSNGAGAYIWTILTVLGAYIWTILPVQRGVYLDYFNSAGGIYMDYFNSARGWGLGVISLKA